MSPLMRYKEVYPAIIDTQATLKLKSYIYVFVDFCVCLCVCACKNNHKNRGHWFAGEWGKRYIREVWGRCWREAQEGRTLCNDILIKLSNQKAILRKIHLQLFRWLEKNPIKHNKNPPLDNADIKV